MAAWPETLPLPLQDGYKESPPNTTLRTAMDAGPDKVRRRYTAKPRNITIKYHMTKAQIETLDTFYVTTTLSGSLWFDWTHPRTGNACSARFINEPDYSSIDQNGEVSCAMEVI